jgi:hypothetical protein
MHRTLGLGVAANLKLFAKLRINSGFLCGFCGKHLQLPTSAKRLVGGVLISKLAAGPGRHQVHPAHGKHSTSTTLLIEMLLVHLPRAEPLHSLQGRCLG